MGITDACQWVPSTWVAVCTVVERGLDVAKIPKANLEKKPII
jgi:hypothetical protein